MTSLLDETTLGWIGTGMIVIAASAGWYLRRARIARWPIRMLPHEIAGYTALGVVVAHAFASGKAMGGAQQTGIWLATGALAALCAQAAVGTSMLGTAQRARLRLVHRVLLWSIVGLTSAHLALNAPFAAMLTLR